MGEPASALVGVAHGEHVAAFNEDGSQIYLAQGIDAEFLSRAGGKVEPC